MKKPNLKSLLSAVLVSMSIFSFAYLNLQNQKVSEAIASGKLKFEEIIETSPEVLADFSLVKVFIYIVKGAS